MSRYVDVRIGCNLTSPRDITVRHQSRDRAKPHGAHNPRPLVLPAGCQAPAVGIRGLWHPDTCILMYIFAWAAQARCCEAAVHLICGVIEHVNCYFT